VPPMPKAKAAAEIVTEIESGFNGDRDARRGDQLRARRAAAYAAQAQGKPVAEMVAS
jgi:hypothetical protein